MDRWRLKGYLGDNVERKHILVSETNIARCYGLPKIHKNDYPLRLVVSNVDSPKCKLSKILEQILTKSIIKPDSHIKNTWQFKESIQNLKIPPDHIMVSFDVVSMFPSIPLDLIKKSIISNWKEIEKHTKIPQKEFLKAIDFLINSTYFKFNNKFYKQIFGMAIGDSSSPILGDLVFYELEKHIFKKFDSSLVYYGRYVDDTFLIIPKNKLLEIFKEFNDYHPRIKFTYEVEQKYKINFLDLTIYRNNDGTICTNWYRKNTYSGRFLNYLSCHPYHQKISLVKNLTDRAIKLADKKFHKENINIIKK